VGPFDRFNDRAKRVLALAQDEAIRFNHNYIGTEHLLLGLVREGEGAAARALHALGVDLSQVRRGVEARLGRGDSTTPPSQITLSPRTKKVIELAIDEARRLGHSHVGTEHLLLGLAREAGTLASQVLESLGVTLDAVRNQVIATIGQAAPAPAGIPTPPAPQVSPREIEDRLEGQSQRAWRRAYWEAGRLNDEEVTPVHLLLALIEKESILVRQILIPLGVDLDKLAAALIAAAPARQGEPPPGLQESVALGETLARAWSFAVSRHSARVRVEHLLLAVGGDAGSAGKTLADQGATAERIRAVIDGMSR
jgi:ATP-dependent Clp protease ATP-binding subunit ClpA